MNWRIYLMSLLRGVNYVKIYKEYLNVQFEGTKEIIEKQMYDNAMRIFKFHVQNNAGYRAFLDSKNFDYHNLCDVNWGDIPLMTKDDINEFNPIIKKNAHQWPVTGGSTGQPFRYALSKDSAKRLWPVHWMLHAEFGLVPYASMLRLTGVGKQSWQEKFYYKLSNFHAFDAYSMSEVTMREMYELIQRKHIKFIYGFSSAVNQFLHYLKDNNLFVSLKGIVTTSDNRIMENYTLAHQYCNCDVFDQYGARDGNVSAFECHCHSGLHVMHENSLVEIVNGEIVTTDIHNTACAFIRYKNGDLAEGEELIKEKCQCGRTLFRLKGIDGRTAQCLEGKDGTIISAVIFNRLFRKEEYIKRYQVVEKINCIEINVHVDDENDKKSVVKKFSLMLNDKLKKEVVFEFNMPIRKLANGKSPLYIKDE